MSSAKLAGRPNSSKWFWLRFISGSGIEKKGRSPLSLAPRGRAPLDVEGLAAAALILHVGIVELEALVQALAGEVELGAFQELKALRIDDDLHAVALEGLIFRIHRVGVFDPVGKAGTARGAHAQAQTHSLPSFGEEIGDVSRGAFGQSDHGSQAALASFSAGCARPCFFR